MLQVLVVSDDRPLRALERRRREPDEHGTGPRDPADEILERYF
jgi:hypothetical protein